ncbi:hypothetical protein KK137_08155 [Croceibacterium sp. LX-88]|uniref:SH3 domain-containing protein n=1 Tax=Croceibacterium selenioxidans TaxID=2838833 RepID=A0ABS5W3G6_9SPHN|nr:SH3 domain-containing protein [Croceibacterium selenioxidans]MBT2134301.1 hypothetical protein [Croceibacterium selenioxidans]
MRLRLAPTLLLPILLCHSESALAESKWAPQDTCSEVEGARSFLDSLKTAVETRDTDAVIALATDDILLDFGGGAGGTELRSRLDDGLWGELDKLLALGCVVNPGGDLTLPWIFEQDLGDADPFSTMLVVARDEPVRAEPSASARVIATISWDLVEVASLDSEQPFQAVTLADGREGYVATGRLRSIVDYRLIASRVGGQWKIAALVTGD